MITQFQFKLFANDPKFRDIPPNNKNAQQIALQKVYIGQKQLHRKNVIMDSIAKKSNPNLSQPNLQIDFIQSRMHAFQMMLVQDIRKLYEDVSRIKGAYQSRISIQTQIDQKLRDIAQKVSAVESQVGQQDEQQLKIVQRVVNEIERLYEQNKRLKEQNTNMIARIQKKKNLTTKKNNKIAQLHQKLQLQDTVKFSNNLQIQ